MEGPFDYTDSNFFADASDSEDTALGDIKHFTKLPARNSPVLYPSGVASNFESLEFSLLLLLGPLLLRAGAAFELFLTGGLPVFLSCLVDWRLPVVRGALFLACI